MKRGLVLAVAFLLASAGLVFAGEPKAPAVVFMLASAGGDPGPISFTLAPNSTGPTVLAGPGGAGVIEDYATGNTALGWDALHDNLTGISNNAFGMNALYGNTTGRDNVAVGSGALYNNTSGRANVAVGNEALRANISGVDNIAIGYALPFLGIEPDRQGSGNVAIGSYSSELMERGNGNTVIGTHSMRDGGGNYNTIMGFGTGSYSFGHFNILLGPGVSADIDDVRNESNTIRIGSPYNPGAVPNGPPYDQLGTASIPTGLFAGQNRTFIAGIVETPMTAEMSPAVVGITAEGRLGTMNSDLLPPGPKGDKGDPGLQGPAGEGLISGSLLFLPASVAAPAGYSLLGATEYSITQPGKKSLKLTVNVYQKQ
jgi:hypothetical protein